MRALLTNLRYDIARSDLRKKVCKLGIKTFSFVKGLLLTPDISYGDVSSGVITFFQIVKEAVLTKKTSSGNVRITKNGDFPTTLLTSHTSLYKPVTNTPNIPYI